MSTHIIRWQNPPTTWAEEVEKELRQRPGEWALIFENHQVTQAQIDKLEDQGITVRLDPEHPAPRTNFDLYARI